MSTHPTSAATGRWRTAAGVVAMAVLALGTVLLGTTVIGGTPAGAALPAPPPGCGFTLTFSNYGGALGSTYLSAQTRAVSPVESCTTTVVATASLTPDNGVAYTNVADNPTSQPLTLTFTPGRQGPLVLLRYTFHCADPAGVGTLHLSAGGQTVTQSVGPESCDGQSGASLGLSTVPSSSYVSIASTADGGGQVVGGQNGNVSLEGDAGPQPTVFDPTGIAVAADPVGVGYWVAGTDGSVYSYGSAGFYGSAFTLHLNLPVVGMAPTPDGRGYWLVATDGGIFAYGDAGYFGSMGGHPLNAPVVGMAATPDGRGYWLVAADGGVFAFGDAAFDGSAGSLLLNAPVTGMAADAHGGYWLVASDGGVFAYGPAGFYGSAATLNLVAPISAITASPDGAGYALLGADGGIFAYGSSRYFGSPNST